MNEQHVHIVTMAKDDDAQINKELTRIINSDRVDLYQRWLIEHHTKHRNTVVGSWIWAVGLLGWAVFVMSTATNNSDHVGGWITGLAGIFWLFVATWETKVWNRCRRLTAQTLQRLITLERGQRFH